MPALITHCLFASMANRLLADGTLATESEKRAFYVGNQGPDPFFFRHSTLSGMKRSHEVAKRMHREDPLGVFRSMHAVLSRMGGDDARIARAAVLGFLGHYALDSCAHPFIYAQQYAVIEASGKDGMASLEDAQSEVHALIESQLDVWLLWQLRKQTTAQLVPASVLELPTEAQLPAGTMMAAGAYALGIELPETDYGSAVGDMQRVYRLIEPAGSSDTKTIGIIERLFRSHSMLESLAHEVGSDGSCAWTNETHAVWTNPFTGESNATSFLETLFQALELYPKLVDCLTSGVFDPQLFMRDYRGAFVA